MTPPPFPWEEAMRIGLGMLQWPPQAFWGATPRELAAAIAPLPADSLGRSTLDALIARYPDRGFDHGRD